MSEVRKQVSMQNDLRRGSHVGAMTPPANVAPLTDLIKSEDFSGSPSAAFFSDSSAAPMPSMSASNAKPGSAHAFAHPPETSSIDGLEDLLRDQLESPHVLLMVELTQAWCGACQALKLVHQRLLSAVHVKNEFDDGSPLAGTKTVAPTGSLGPAVRGGSSTNMYDPESDEEQEEFDQVVLKRVLLDPAAVLKSLRRRERKQRQTQKAVFSSSGEASAATPAASMTPPPANDFVRIVQQASAKAPKRTSISNSFGSGATASSSGFSLPTPVGKNTLSKAPVAATAATAAAPDVSPIMPAAAPPLGGLAGLAPPSSKAVAFNIPVDPIEDSQFGAMPILGPFVDAIMYLLHMYEHSTEPVFMFLRGEDLVAIVEGMDAPKLERTVAHLTALPPPNFLGQIGSRWTRPTSVLDFLEDHKPLLDHCRPRLHRYAFKLQCLWRRHQQRKRIGVFIDGVFYSYAELAEREKKLAQEALQREWIALQQEKAVVLQAFFRGNLTRKQVEENRKTLQARAKMLTSRKRTKRESIYHPHHQNVLPHTVQLKLQVLAKAYRVKWHMAPGVAEQLEQIAAANAALQGSTSQQTEENGGGDADKSTTGVGESNKDTLSVSPRPPSAGSRRPSAVPMPRARIGSLASRSRRNSEFPDLLTFDEVRFIRKKYRV